MRGNQIDAADKLKPGFGWTNYKLRDQHTEEEIENDIIQMIGARVDEKLKSMNEAERKKKAEEVLARMDLMAEINGNVKNIVQNAQLRAQVSSAVAAGTVGSLFAAPAAAALFYTGLWGGLSAAVFGVGGGALLAGGLLVALPLALVGGIAIGGGPAYRKSIPVTLAMIGIRKRIGKHE